MRVSETEKNEFQVYHLSSQQYCWYKGRWYIISILYTIYFCVYAGCITFFGLYLIGCLSTKQISLKSTYVFANSVMTGAWRMLNLNLDHNSSILLMKAFVFFGLSRPSPGYVMISTRTRGGPQRSARPAWTTCVGSDGSLLSYPNH